MEHISRSLEIGQPGPSLTWRTETRKCSNCGAEFQTKIASRDGQDYPSAKKCADCSEKEREAERKAKLEQELKEAIEEQREFWWDEANLGAKFVEKTFDNFNHKLQPEAYALVKGYSGKSMILLSPNIYGVGKTHLMAALVNHLITTQEPASIGGSTIHKRRCPVYYTNENELLARIRATFESRYEDHETERSIYNFLASIELLIIDDVGKVRPKDYSFLQSVYFRIIDDRYNNESPIILTTNLGYDELEEHIGGACADRLREMCGKNFIKMVGQSYRRQK